ncbi:Serine/threonine-protein kinase PknD [Alphaproteobacteria bacterium SO-S41]|nr:Serine/threonine-protein kinase PknD [Alphaproteobacteria bacterium SO-S41]
MSDVFISYAREDRAWVETLAAALEHAGLTVWWEARPQFGQSVNDEIEQALAAAKAVLGVWSKAALASRSVKAETADALERGVLLSVLKEDVTLPLAFRGLPGADLTGWSGGADDALDDLVRQIKTPDHAAPALGVDDRTKVSAHPAAPEEERTVFQPRALRAGEVVAHYRIVGPLGEGGSGKIFEARNIHNEDERVALKILQPGMADRSQFLAFLRAEANALQRVKNEAVVQYRTFGRIPDSDEFFLVIEYVEGPTLAAALRQRRFTEDELRRLAIRIADGLGAAHDQNVIHRDLSPDNVVLPGGNPDRATLIDFGIARIGPIDQLGNAFAGKLSYAAPEQFDGNPELIGPWTDLYSLGLLLIAAARGRKLDMGRDIASAIAVRRAVPVLDGVPEGLHGALKALLQPLPAARVRTAADAAALFMEPTKTAVPLPRAAPVSTTAAPLISVRDPVIPPPKAGDPLIIIRDAAPEAAETQQPGSRRRWLWLGGAGALIAAGVAAVLLLGLPGDQAPPPSDPLPPVVEVPPETPAEPTPVEPEAPPPEPEELAEPKADDLLDPAVAPLVMRARETAMVAREAEAKAAKAAESARAVETAARARASEADGVAAIACAAGADSQLYFCGSPDGHPDLTYRGQVGVTDTGAIVSDGLGVLEDTGDNLIHRGLFRAGQPDGEGVRAMLDPDGAAVGFDDCAGRWDHDVLQPQGVCLWRARDGETRITIAGGYKAGKAEGPAVASYAGEGTFSGDVAAGRATGHGVYVAANGARAELAYGGAGPVSGVVTVMRDGKPVGRYEGELGPEPAVPNGQPFTFNGFGVFYTADGAIAAQGRWKDGRLEQVLGKQGDTGKPGFEPLPALTVLAPDPRLVAALKDAEETVGHVAADVARADAAAKAAKAAAAATEKPVAEAELAAVKARAAAKKACAQTPAPKGLACFATDSGGHYAGEATCTKTGVCVSRGFGVLAFDDGWSFAGLWGKTSIDSGCEIQNDVVRYCGEENDPEVDSLGKFTRDDGLIGTGRSNAKAETFVGIYDFSAVAGTGIKRIIGTGIHGKVEGPGWLEGKDGSLYRGGFSSGKRTGFAKATSADGARIAALYAKGVATSGAILFADDRRYVGEMGGGNGFKAVPNGLGVLYAPNGRIERQGRWKDGALIEAYGPAGALADGADIALPGAEPGAEDNALDLTFGRVPVPAE